MGPSNQYEATINMVGGVLEPYDYDKQYPVFGFGGKPTFMNETKVNHCFPLTGSATNPMVTGIQGILGAYRATLPNIKLSGPTYFAPILTEFKNHC